MNRSPDTLDRIQIVLVHPQEAANIGSVCRAMKTMGISRLAVVSDTDYDIDRIKTLSLHAYDVYENHRRFQTLEQALSDSVFSAGATRRRGKFRKYSSLLPEQFVQKFSLIDEGIVSIVFGRESDGLTDEELRCCDAATHIPTSEAFPSLNLAQAVQIYTYACRTMLTPAEGHVPVDRVRLEGLTETITGSLEKIHFYKQNEREEVRLFFRDLLGRASVTETESKRLEKMFRKIAALKIHGQYDKG
jgi:tRNA/rRNA methyltransferase